MQKLVILLILLVLAIFTAGCSEKTQENSTSSEVKSENVVAITQLEQINTSLQKTPVFVKIGTRWCPECRSLKPILQKLAAEYQGKATIGSIDADKNPELAEYFGVEIIPNSFVIVGIENGTYVYMQENGSVSTNGSQARFVGRSIDDEKMFEKTLNFSIVQQGKSKSM